MSQSSLSRNLLRPSLAKSMICVNRMKRKTISEMVWMHCMKVLLRSANMMLNKTTVHVTKMFPCRVCSMNGFREKKTHVSVSHKI